MYCIWELHVGLGNKFSKFQTPHQGQISQQGVPAARPRPRCWFDYNSQNPSCSPYVGILRYLQRKKLATPWSQGGLTSLGWLEWRVCGIFCFIFIFQPGAAFLAICFILELAKICVLHAFWSQNLSFACPLGFWLLAFGFGFTWLYLASLGLWLVAFGFWFWFHLFFFGRSLIGSWRSLGFSIVVCV